MTFQIEGVSEVSFGLWRVLASYAGDPRPWVVFHLTQPPQFLTPVEKKRPPQGTALHIRPLLPGDELICAVANFREYQTKPLRFRQATYLKSTYLAVERLLMCPLTEARWKAEE